MAMIGLDIQGSGSCVTVFTEIPGWAWCQSEGRYIYRKSTRRWRVRQRAALSL